MLPRLRGAVRRSIAAQRQRTWRSRRVDSSEWAAEQRAFGKKTSAWRGSHSVQGIRWFTGPRDARRGGLIRGVHGDGLQSGFPMKSVGFLLVVGGLVYYFVDVEGVGWMDHVLSAYEDEELHSVPLHFNAGREDLEHYLQYHLSDPAVALREPSVVKLLSEHFEKLAYGWRMTEDEAKTDGIPVTHGCRFRSNVPCEDFFSLGTSPGPGEQPWNYWGIFDGHAGLYCANMLQWTLIPQLSSALLALPKSAASAEIESTIKRTFLRVDKTIMERARTAANWFPAANASALLSLAPAFSGSCALLATFNPLDDTLRVACVGDSRAVLGRWDPATRSYTSIPLSIDQTGFNEDEVTRLAQEHPGEDDMIDRKSGRLLGLAVTRAFGDHRWKWDNDFISKLKYSFGGTSPRPGSKTPPYLTAEPEITETEIVRVAAASSGRSDFMIMASDGLWDRISSEHAVECVQRWLEAKARGGGSVSNDPRLVSNPPQIPSSFTELEEGIELDVEKGVEVDWKATPEYFAIEDENAAICLARNAFGGTRRGLFTGVVSVQAPLARNFVDDTTIMVVFFDKVEGAGGRVDGGKGEKEKEKEKKWWKPW